MRRSVESSQTDAAERGQGATPQKHGNTGTISDLFDKNILARLELAFLQSDTGNNTLMTQEFRELMVRYIPLSLVDSIYRSIDVNDVGYINYSDFTNYLIASEEGSTFSSKSFVSRLVMNLEQEEEGLVTHRDMIDCMVYVKKPCAMIITGGRDGQVSLWHAESLELITHIQHRAKNSVYEEELHSRMDKVLKAKVAKMSVSANQRRQARVAITALCPLLGGSGLLCVGSADACLTLYDIATQDVIGRFTNLEYIPTSIECFHRKQSFHFADATSNVLHDMDVPIQHIAIGDAMGGVCIIKLHVEFGLSTEVGMKKKNQILFAQSIVEGCTKLSVVNDWITQMHFVVETDALIIASVDGTVSFLDVARGAVIRTFSAHDNTKIGIKTFAWSAFGKYVVSGADRALLFWDLFTLETVYKIENLKSPVVYVDVQDTQNKLFAILVNKTIHVWHNITYELLQTVTDESVYKPLNVLTAMVFSPDLKMLFTAGNRITAWTLERSTEGQNATDSHEDLCSVLYNNMFSQVVMVKALGVVKVYQAETGEIVRQFSVLPLNSRTGQPTALKADPLTGQFAPVIKHACFDKMQSRLIVTAHDLSVQFWNLNDGSPLLQVNPQLYSTTLAHIYASLPKSVSTTSYETLSSGTNKRVKKLLLVGTEQGNLCGYQEANSLIEECPVFFLRLTDFAPMEHVVKSAVNSEERNGRLNTLVSGLMHHRTERTGSVQFNPQDEMEAQLHHANRVKHANMSAHTAHNVHAANSVHDSHNGSHHNSHTNSYNNNSHLGSHVDDTNAAAVASPARTMARSHTAELLHHSSENSVLWMELIENTHVLMVGYFHGLVALWDLDKLHRLHDLPMHQYGPVLMCMRSKDFLKTHHAKQASQLSRYMKPLFQDIAFSTKIAVPPLKPAESNGTAQNTTTSAATSSNGPEKAPSVTPALPAPLIKTLSGRMTPDKAEPPVGSPAARRSLHGAHSPRSPAGSRSPSMTSLRKSISGRLSRSSSGDANDDTMSPERALPKLNFSRPGDSSAPKLLTGSRTRKASVLKVSAQKIGAMRRASAMLVRPPEGMFAPPQDTSPKHSPKLNIQTRHHSRSAHPRTSSMGESSDDDSVDNSHLALRKASEPALSHEQWNPDGTMGGYSGPPVASAPASGLSRRRDSAAIVFAGGESFLSRFKRNMGSNATAPHRRLSVALNPQQQYGRASALETQHSESVVSQGSMMSPQAPRASVSGAQTQSAVAAKIRGSGILNGPLTNMSSTAPVSSTTQLFGDSLAQDSVMSLAEPSVVLLEASTATADSTNMASYLSSSVDNTHDNSNSSNAGSHADGEAPAKIIVDSLIVLAQAQVIIGACSDKYIRFWDLETHHILCSCLYYHTPEHHHDSNLHPDPGPVVPLAALPVTAVATPAFNYSTVPTVQGASGSEPHLPVSAANAHLHPHHAKPTAQFMATQPTEPAAPAEGAAHRHHEHRHHHGHGHHGHHGHGHHHKQHEVPLDEVLRVLKVSDSEDLLIGAYDTGMIRTWSIQSYSLVTLKGLLNKYLASIAPPEDDDSDGEDGVHYHKPHAGRKDSSVHNTNHHQHAYEAEKEKIESANPFGSSSASSAFGAMAISPITLLHEWLAHKSPFVSLEYVWFDPSAFLLATQSVSTSEKYVTTSTVSTKAAPVVVSAGLGSPSRRVTVFSGSAKLSAPAHDKTPQRPESSLRSTESAKDNSFAKPKTPRGTSMKDQFDTVSSARAALQNLSMSDSHETLAKLQQQTKRPKRLKNSDMGNDILEGFILSAGLDQRVLLWNLAGKCVGEFGTYGWDITSEATWYKGPNERAKRTHHKTKKAPAEMDLEAHYARETAARNITKDNADMVRSPSSILIQNIGKHRHHTSKELNEYVEALSRKISNKPPVYLDENTHFSSIMTHHPMVETSRKKNKKYVAVRHKSED